MTRKRWALAAAAVLVAATCGVVVMSGAEQPTAAARAPAADPVKVEQGELSAMVSQGLTLTYRARSDGSPYLVINRARGVYTDLPDSGDEVGCGDVLHRVDDRPVVLLCGRVPAYRALHVGVKGRDVRQLNRNLHVRGAGDAFTTRTERALRVLQRKKDVGVTGKLAIDDAVFLPEAVRIAKVTGQVGGSARPGAPVLSATSDTLHVQVNLDASQQGQVKKGDRAQITLPGNTPVTGRVAGLLGLGIVALIVGAVGVANIMIISVLERRSEIGLRRALGATKSQIRTQFLGESILLALIGGVVGVLAGVVATVVYASTKSWAVVIPVEAWSGGIASAILIGAFAGLMPAVRASRMPPTVALRTV